MLRNKSIFQISTLICLCSISICNLLIDLPSYNYEEHYGKAIKIDGRKVLLDERKHIGISGRDGVRNYRGIFQLGPD
jgi:hypothetical protein